MRITIYKNVSPHPLARIQVNNDIPEPINSVDEINSIIDNLELAIIKLKEVKYSAEMG